MLQRLVDYAGNKEPKFFRYSNLQPGTGLLFGILNFLHSHAHFAGVVALPPSPACSKMNYLINKSEGKGLRLRHVDDLAMLNERCTIYRNKKSF